MLPATLWRARSARHLSASIVCAKTEAPGEQRSEQPGPGAGTGEAHTARGPQGCVGFDQQHRPGGSRAVVAADRHWSSRRYVRHRHPRADTGLAVLVDRHPDGRGAVVPEIRVWALGAAVTRPLLVRQ